jgi:hypothetical protein
MPDPAAGSFISTSGRSRCWRGVGITSSIGENRS